MTARDCQVPVVLLDPQSIADPTRFVSEIVGLPGYAVETDFARVQDQRLILTYLDSPLAESLIEAPNVRFSLCITPQEQWNGLDAHFVRRATSVTIVGHNETCAELVAVSPVETRISGALWPGTCCAGDREPSVESAASEALGLSGIVNLLFPESYLFLWEHWVQHRAVPRLVRTLTHRALLPPTWFVDKLESFGATFEVHVDSPHERARFLEQDGQLVRDNNRVDAIDLALWECPRRIVNLRTDGDLRDDVTAASVVDWVSVLERTAATSASTDAPDTAPNGERIRSVTSSRPVPRINIVCYNPTYLFADLVRRFERAGCVHSDLPLPDADAYIWMRPQEFGAFGDLVREYEPVDVPASYVQKFEEHRDDYSARDVARVEDHSVAIHHGTCFEPIIQFDAFRLAKKLSTVRKVAGVCELEECYGPSFSHANPHNFEFVPIGYDHTLFTEEVIRTETRNARDPLRIGFVGRAYGTDKREDLEKSVYAHPKGYRKGGDHMVNILLRLKARGVDVELHLVGNRWEERVVELGRFGIKVISHTRDTTITYRDYPSVFAGMDVLLIAARAEGGPVAAIEAMSVGAAVVGTNVGVLPYLAQNTDHCHAVRYDTKWHVMDYAAAEAALEAHWNRTITKQDRLAVRASVAQHTTDRWVNRLCELAKDTVRGDE